MEIMDLVAQIFELCILPLLVILSKYLISWISAKIENVKLQSKSEIQIKYLTMLNDTIADCINATTQTYVTKLKEQGSFDDAAQKVAFSLTFDAIKHLMTAEAEQYLTEMVGDIDVYITQRIESQLKISKE